MARRLPSQPPVLPGFSHMHVLGSGGFADVFLYEQNMPRRQVAVKVMLSEVVNDQVRQMFQAEANLMAQLSAHPSILTVYQASVSADGRPYLVMELCSSSLSERYRRERIPVADVLRIAVKIGSALETAHRQGVLHRDVKPSNILMTAYGHPVLSDFGIAASLGESEPSEVVGLSIPWSAPEVLRDDSSGTIASEVWSLGATVYSLLAGRSPFEVMGGSNTSSDLMARIEKGRFQAIGRTDVPSGLEATLARALSHRPENRQGSILELIREFQQVESEIGVAQTAIEVAVDDWALATVADLEDRTRVRGSETPTSGSSNRRRRRRPAASSTPVSRTLDTGARNSNAIPRSTGTRPAGPVRRRQYLWWGVIAAAAVLIALGGVATLFLVRSTSTDIPRVSDIQATTKGSSIEFSWADPGIRSGDSYLVTQGTDSSTQTSSTFLAPVDSGQQVCITVTVTREGKPGQVSAEKCASPEETG
ncbi:MULTISPECIES: serine/threonine-protein kinase [unclassified Frondihabitans]|uniref:serine/threonine-protein kinase n=1 Tax=unclassified Frondihabitans TaxID=2626248 RepID=UPI000F4FCF4D|nr:MULTISPECIES: serine/threonine-protein kinase [unclassified Frondihabitans]RPE74547.1 serine/threonine protein kinase [Frondihabitans sp. PhB153]RPF02976.1 serine/threonine protein kinase [Frondihabitans sp. PhB161]